MFVLTLQHHYRDTRRQLIQRTVSAVSTIPAGEGRKTLSYGSPISEAYSRSLAPGLH